MEKKSIFRKESLERVESPEQLDAYIQVSRPAVWVVMAALVIAAISVIVWGIVGSLPETMMVSGVTTGANEIRAYMRVDDANTSLEGCKISASLPDGTSVSGVVQSVSPIPYSADEIRQSITYDWIAEHAIPDTYAYEILIATDSSVDPDLLVQVSITTNEIKPIELIFG